MKIKSFVQDIRDKHKEAIKWSTSVLIFVAIFFIGSWYHQRFGYEIILPNVSFDWFTNINFAWIKDYQTLIVGIFAAMAAYFAGKQLQISRNEARNASIARCWEIINSSRGKSGNRGQIDSINTLIHNKATLYNANFHDIDLTNFEFKDQIFNGVNFRECNYDCTRFINCHFNNCRFSSKNKNPHECDINLISCTGDIVIDGNCSAFITNSNMNSILVSLPGIYITFYGSTKIKKFINGISQQISLYTKTDNKNTILNCIEEFQGPEIIFYNRQNGNFKEVARINIDHNTTS